MPVPDQEAEPAVDELPVTVTEGRALLEESGLKDADKFT